MIRIKLEKKDLWLLAAVMVFVAGVGYVIAWNSSNPSFMGHNSDNVFIYLNGNSKNLQTAINNGEFYSPFSGGSSYSGQIVQGHPGENVIVNVNGTVKSFQQSINDGSLCNATLGKSPANFGTQTYGNTGNEIRVTIDGVNKDLQTAINNEDLSGCVFKYVDAASSRIIPEIISRGGGTYEAQVVTIVFGYGKQYFTNMSTNPDSTQYPMIFSSGAQSSITLLYGNETNAKIIGLIDKNALLSTLPQNGVVNLNFTIRMMPRKTYFRGNVTFTITA